MRDLVSIFLEAITDETIHDHGLIPPRVVHGAKSVIEALNKDAEEAHVTILLSNLGKVYNLLRQEKKIKITNRNHTYQDPLNDTGWCSKVLYMFANPQMNRLIVHLENGKDVDAEINLLDCMYLFRDKVEEYVEEPKFEYFDVVVISGMYSINYKKEMLVNLAECCSMVKFEEIISVDENGNEMRSLVWPVSCQIKRYPKKVKFRV